MQTSKAETRATVEMSDLMRDGYYLAQVRRSDVAGCFKMAHHRNGNVIDVEWQTEPVPCMSVVKNGKVVNIVYV
jgi:hypothetical protein